MEIIGGEKSRGTGWEPYPIRESGDGVAVPILGCGPESGGGGPIPYDEFLRPGRRGHGQHDVVTLTSLVGDGAGKLEIRNAGLDEDARAFGQILESPLNFEVVGVSNENHFVLNRVERGDHHFQLGIAQIDQGIAGRRGFVVFGEDELDCGGRVKVE